MQDHGRLQFDLPTDVIFPVADVDVRLDPAPHPFEIAHGDAIEQNWRKAVAANPAFFDGRVALLSELGYDDGRLVGRCHIVRFATFLYWRTLRPTVHAGHAYTHAMLVSADNALVAIRMGDRTANPGLIYFAAGSFEAQDFRDGRADVTANMHREVMEETGIDLAGVPHEDRLHGISKATGTAVFRRYFLADVAETVAAAIRRFVATQDAPEIEGPVIIRALDDLPDRLAPQMLDLVRWHFANPPDRPAG